MTDMEKIKQKIDTILEPLLTNIPQEWSDVLIKIPGKKKAILLKKLKTLLITFIQTQFFNHLTAKGLYNGDQDQLKLNQKQTYQDISLDILSFIRDFTHAGEVDQQLNK
jgi:hypothetical protein